MTDYNLMITDTILPALKADSQKQAFHVLAEYAAHNTPLEKYEILQHLNEQERSGVVSGIGSGVALLSVVSSKINEPYTILARADQAIVYDSVDGDPVDLLYMIIAPENDGPIHLQRLARITRQFKDNLLCNKLRNADSVDAIKAVLFDSSHKSLAA